MKTTSHDTLKKMILSDFNASAAYKENEFRRELSKVISNQLQQAKLSEKDFAMELKIPYTHVKRLLHKELGGSLPLISIFKALEYFKCGTPILIKISINANY